MAKSVVGVSQEQRDFVKLFDTLTGRYSRWEVWKDMVWMLAIAISNRVDKRYFDKREAIYMDIVKKYSKSELDTFAKLYGLLVSSVISRTERGNWGDFLGELFMGLNLGNEMGGQFFTPYHVSHLMARVTIEADLPSMKREIEEKGYFSCYDSAVGAGAMLIAAAEVCAEQGINYPFQVMFSAQEIDSTTALMCYVQLSILGCAGYVVIGDTIADPATGHVLFGENSERCWYTPMFFEETWHKRREIEIARQKFRRLFGAINDMKPSAADKTCEAEPIAEESRLALPEPEAKQEAATPPQEPTGAADAADLDSPTPTPAGAHKTPRRRGKRPEGQISLFDL